MKAVARLGVLAVLAILAAVVPAAALETVTILESTCTTAQTVFQLGATVCARVAGVAGGDLNNIWLRWVAPSGTVVAGSPTGVGNTVVTTDPQTFTFTLPTSGVGAERGLWTAETANVVGSAARVGANFRVPRQTVIGVHRDATSTSFTRNTNTTGFGEGSVVFGQQAGDIRLWGDWFGTGRYTPGFYRPGDGTFHFAMSNVTPTDDVSFQFGPIDAQAQPLAGDWTGDGTTKIGVFLNGQVQLRNTLSAGPADTTFLYGQAGDRAFAGDFDGDGIWTVGVYRDDVGVGIAFLRNTNTSGVADTFFFYGLPGDQPIAGNWTAAANGMSTIGVFRQSEGTFYLRNSNDAGFADIAATLGTVTDVAAVTAHNEAPVVTAGGTLNYIEGSAATAIDPAVTVTDMDNATLVGATIDITGNCQATEDVLSFANTANITGGGGACNLALSGTDTVANYQAALRNVKYNNTAANPNTGNRTVTWRVNDGSLVNNLSNQPTSGITIACPTITVNGTIPDLVLNQAMATATFTQTGGNGTITWSASGLPNGIGIDASSGDVTGTPTQSGSFPATITATDQSGCIGTKNITVVVNVPPQITSADTVTFRPGLAGQTFTVTTTGSPTNTITRTDNPGVLPSGVTFTDNLNNTATIAGTPAAGTQTNSPYAWQITATNTAGNAMQNFTFRVECPTITVSGGSNPLNLVFGTAMTPITFTQAGGSGPITWSFSGGPAGLSIDPGTGQLTGTPTQTGIFSPATVTATDAGNCVGTLLFTINVAPVANAATYNNLVDNTQFVITGGTTSSPSTPFVGQATKLSGQPAGFTVTPETKATTANGSVTIATDGTFIFTPRPDPQPAATTVVTFTFTVVSNGVTSAPATVTLNLGNRVWYVNPNAVSNGNGLSHTPWNSTANIKQQPTAGGANTGDIIFVYSGPAGNLTANIPLLNNQTLHGQQATNLVVNSSTLNNTAGTPPSLTASAANVVSVANGNTIKSLTLTGSSNALITGAPAGLTVDTVTMTPSGTAHGFNITGGSGNVTVNSVTMTGTSTGDVVRVNTGTQTWTFTNSPITQTAGRALNVTNKTQNGMSFDANSTVTVSAGTTAGAVTLTNNTGAGNTFGFSRLFLTTNGAAGLLANTTGTINTSDTVGDTTSTLSAAGAAAIDVSGVTAGMRFAMVSVSGAPPTNAVALTNVAGSVIMNGGSVNTTSGRAVLVDGGTGTVTYAGNISNTTGTGISVTNKTGGTVTFSGQSITLSTGGNSGVSLVNNTGATIAFTPAAGGTELDITTTTGTAFNATGGGTVNVSGTGNTITTTTGTGVNISGIGGTIALRSVTVNVAAAAGAANGIVIQNTTAGAFSFTVDGDGTTTTVGGGASPSGGTITRASGADGAVAGNGVYLDNTGNITLRRMAINGVNQNHGIRGNSVTNFNLQYSTVSGTNGTNSGLSEGSVVFDNLLGAATITNCIIEGGFSDNLNVVNTTGTLDRLVITGSTFGFNGSTNGNNSILMEVFNPGTLKWTLQSSTLKGARSDWVNAQSSGGSGIMDSIIGGVGVGNTFDNLGANAHPAAVANGNRILLNANGTHTFNVSNNTLNGSLGNALAITGLTGTAVMTGRIQSNDIGTAGTNDSGSTGAGGISVQSGAGSDITVLVDGNDVRQYNNHGIIFTLGDEMGNAAVINATVSNNTTNTPGTLLTDFNGFHVNSGTVSTDDFTACFNISSNNFTGGGKGGVSPNNNDLRLRQRQGTTVQLPGYTGPARDNTDNAVAEVVTYLQTTKSNTFGSATANSVSTGGGYTNTPGGAACTLPP